MRAVRPWDKLGQSGQTLGAFRRVTTRAGEGDAPRRCVSGTTATSFRPPSLESILAHLPSDARASLCRASPEATTAGGDMGPSNNALKLTARLRFSGRRWGAAA